MKTNVAKFVALFVVVSWVAFAPAARAQRNVKMNEGVVRPETSATPMLGQGPVSFYVTIQGQKQGSFKGQSSNASHQGQIQGLQFSVTATSPHNMTTGMASGKTQYSTVTLTKPWDASSPQIFQAAISNEVLTSVEFDFVRPGANGQESVFETVRLTNATIASVKDFVRDTESSSGSSQSSEALEDVAFTFQKIQIVNNDGKTTMNDDWTQ